MGKIRYDNQHIEADSFPIILALSAKNTDALIDVVAHQIETIPENPRHKSWNPEYPEKVGVTGLEGGRELKIPYIMNFISQIIAQLELYKSVLSEKPASERQGFLIERLSVLLEYFNFLLESYEKHYDYVPLYDRSSEELLSLVKKKMAQ